MEHVKLRENIFITGANYKKDILEQERADDQPVDIEYVIFRIGINGDAQMTEASVQLSDLLEEQTSGEAEVKLTVGKYIKKNHREWAVFSNGTELFTST